MGEIEVGEYVRTNLGIIYEYTEDEKNDLQMRDFRLCNDGEIVKYSKQLIDLIENKDILKVKVGEDILFIGIDENTSDIKYKEIIEDIKNGECQLLEILTHEQYEQNSYKVGGEDE